MLINDASALRACDIKEKYLEDLNRQSTDFQTAKCKYLLIVFIRRVRVNANI